MEACATNPIPSSSPRPATCLSAARGRSRRSTSISERQFPAWPHEMAGVPARIAQEVILVFRFRLPEIASRNNLGHRFARPQPGSVDIGDRVFRDPLLFFAGIEDGGPIARPRIVPLPIASARIVDLEKELEDLPIADARRVEHDL